jgi:hypothetical protein
VDEAIRPVERGDVLRGYVGVVSRKAEAITISSRQRSLLERLVRSCSVPVWQAERARIVLMSAAGTVIVDVAAELDIDRQRVRRWRGR